MTEPFHIRVEDAPAAEYSEPCLTAVSHRVVTSKQSENLALYYAKMDAPLDYKFKVEQDLIFYQLEGKAHVSAGGQEYDMQPGEVLLIPANVALHHIAEEPTTMLIIWGPAPESDEHEHG